ncbi:DUF5335 family protein [Carboxylicivirga linearis]|uniref:DUF5335 family protein n=1 Tax=Carboxylicivirga linearis TaxID=1628157 RepID=A0ABS5K1T7_9BACT|nr:DUF5335 family protein [Carboxylicivirga linearis]MBS2101119.1 DUF5335 family protein [Carboxylicivirga linearis]
MSKEKIQKTELQERLQMITSGNHGRKAAIIFDGDVLIQNKPFKRLNYDPVNKGNDFVIELEEYTHTIDAPSDFYLSKDENGVLTAIEVIDNGGKSCSLEFL